MARKPNSSSEPGGCREASSGISDSVPGDPNAIASPLARWYAAHARDLPWRRTRDPYAVWLSEVMCQQTRVSVVIPYYDRFLDRFPTPADLAAAPEDEVLTLWAGLGYYSRGRNLHRAARAIIDEHGGRFPSDLAAIRALPGVGEYTAAAIGSIVFTIAEPVIDGNVERVLARHGAIEGDVKKGEARRELRESARHALDPERPGDHNQAMMELGATICTPRNPRCPECPIASSCRALRRGDPESFPPPRVRRAPETQHWVALVIGSDPKSAARATSRAAVWTIERGADEELLPGHRGIPITRLDDATDRATPPVAKEIITAARKTLRALEPGRRVATAEFTVLPAVSHSITYRRLQVYPVRIEGPLDLAARDPRAIDATDGDRLPALFRKVLASALSARDE